MKAIKKPIEVQAVQLPTMDKFTHEWIKTNKEVVGGAVELGLNSSITTIYRVHTLEGTMLAHPGDFIVRGSHDDVWVVKEHIFKDTYRFV
jgi:hypothetical protein